MTSASLKAVVGPVCVAPAALGEPCPIGTLAVSGWFAQPARAIVAATAAAIRTVRPIIVDCIPVLSNRDNRAGPAQSRHLRLRHARPSFLLWAPRGPARDEFIYIHGVFHFSATRRFAQHACVCWT